MPAEHVNETYYCVGGTVDDSDPSKITFSVVDSFDINRFISAHGPRTPAYPKPLAWSTDADIRVGQITVSDKAFTEAEIAWWTLWNRHYEDDVAYDAAGSTHWGWGGAGWRGGFPTWTYATNGLSRSRTKLRAEACNAAADGAAFRARTCDEPDDSPGVACTLNLDPFQPPQPPSPPPSPPFPPPVPPQPSNVPHPAPDAPSLPPPPLRPLVTIWLVHYDMWVGGGGGELGSGQACLSICEADATCVGLQMHSDISSQCYKLTDDHIQNIGQGHRPMSMDEAGKQTPVWSVFLPVKVQAPHPPTPPSLPSGEGGEPSPLPPSPPSPPNVCWGFFPGQYLPGCVPSDGCMNHGSMTAAKAACIAAGDECGGVLTGGIGHWEIRQGVVHEGDTHETSYSKEECLPPSSPPPSAPPPFPPQQFSVVMLMELTLSAETNVTAESVIAAAKNLTSDGSSTVTVEQFWKLEFAVPADANVSELAAILEARCQETSPECKLTLVSSGRRALQSDNITATTTGAAATTNTTTTVVLVRQLTSGSLTEEILGINSSGVSLTSEGLEGVGVQLIVTQAGGADEAAALLNGSLSQEQVQTYSADNVNNFDMTTPSPLS